MKRIERQYRAAARPVPSDYVKFEIGHRKDAVPVGFFHHRRIQMSSDALNLHPGQALAIDPRNLDFSPFLIGRNISGVQCECCIYGQIEIALRRLAGLHRIDEIPQLAAIS